jgi:hypothetical protein
MLVIALYYTDSTYTGAMRIPSGYSIMGEELQTD